MLVSTYHLDDTERARARRQWVDARPILIGRANDCHVVLDDPDVADHHLRITSADGGIRVENLATAADIEGTPLATGASLVVAEGRAIRIGGTIVKLRMQASPVVTTTPSPPRPSSAPRPATEPPRMTGTWNPPPIARIDPPGNPPAPLPRRPLTPPRPRREVLSSDATEQAFIATLRAQPGDASTRMVYADWLEGSGQLAKAELVRLAEYLDTATHRTACEIDWRAVVVRTPIERCLHDRCPKHWDALTPAGASDFGRACGVCAKRVLFCGELPEVRAAAFDDVPVVFDVALDRVTAHANYRLFGDEPINPEDESDEIDDDPDGYTLDTPPENYRR